MYILIWYKKKCNAICNLIHHYYFYFKQFKGNVDLLLRLIHVTNKELSLFIFTYSILYGSCVPASEEGSVEVDHDEALVGSQQPEHSVGHVACDIAERARRRVREENGRARHGQRVAHRALRHVRQVY